MPLEASSTFPSMTTADPLESRGRTVERRLADFHPSVWGDYFLHYDPNANSTGADGSAEETVRKLVEEVKAMLTSKEDDDPTEKLELIDHVQHLGIAHHFEDEIDQQMEELHHAYEEFISGRKNGSERLHVVALFFRLLRQHGYNISTGVFNKFKHSADGKFVESLIEDVRGMLSLYEASHMMVHGEDILVEALAFTTAHLKSIDEKEHSPHLVSLVRRALNQPIRKGLPRLEAWHYVQIYQSDPSHDRVLLSLAKLDFNSLQELHQKEAREIIRYGKSARERHPTTHLQNNTGLTAN